MFLACILKAYFKAISKFCYEPMGIYPEMQSTLIPLSLECFCHQYPVIPLGCLGVDTTGSLLIP